MGTIHSPSRPSRAAVIVAAGFLIAGTPWAAPAEAPAEHGSSPRPRLGMNLSHPDDANTELPFVDVFRLSRPWISQKRGREWGEGPELELDEHGWVRSLEPEAWAETLMCTIPEGRYPEGRYTVFYDGRGTIEFHGAARIVSEEPERIIVEVEPQEGAIFLRLTETDPEDYVRNIRVIMPGFDDRYREHPFHPAFLRRWENIASLRFMNWMRINDSTIRRWSRRPTMDSATWSERGVPVEVMVDLCNRLRTDAWFCMPHLADDDYVRRFAEAVHERLDPDLKVYVEHSNEVWNAQFAQARHAQDVASRLGLGPPERPWEGGGMYYAQRSTEVFRIWEEVFGGTERLVRVVAWQSGAVWWMENILFSEEEVRKHADAIAIAPYLHMSVAPSDSDLTADEVASWSVERVLDYVEQSALPESVRQMRQTNEAADDYGLTLIAYEGGQHMVGVGGAENHDDLTRLLHEANRHPRMGDIYRGYLDAWSEAGGDLFCYYSSVRRWTKWGSWGILEYHDDHPRRSPRFTAVMEWARRQGQKMNATGPE